MNVTYATLVESQETKQKRQRMERKLNPSEATWRRLLATARTTADKPKPAPGVAEAMAAFGSLG